MAQPARFLERLPPLHAHTHTRPQKSGGPIWRRVPGAFQAAFQYSCVTGPAADAAAATTTDAVSRNWRSNPAACVQ